VLPGDYPKTPLDVRNLVCLQCDTLHNWKDVKARLEATTRAFDPASAPAKSIRARRAWQHCCRQEIERACNDEPAKYLVCVNCHRAGHCAEECEVKDRWTKRYLGRHERSEQMLYRRINHTASELEEFRQGEKCKRTRGIITKMESLHARIRALAGAPTGAPLSLEALRRANLSPDKITQLVDDIEELRRSDLIFPAEIDKMCTQILENPTLLHD
ncbi:unnamed protein product, partial [Amoebophrya sp. A25]